MLTMKQSLLAPEYKMKIEVALGKELEASNFYKHIANYMDGIGYFGAGKFFRSESEGELEHYQLWVDFVNNRGGIANVPAVPACQYMPMSLMEAFGIYYSMEKDLGDFYNEWSMECEDATINQRLLFFVETQTTSIGEAGDFLATLAQCGDDKGALLLFDKGLNG
jgi:ferritin